MSTLTIRPRDVVAKEFNALIRKLITRAEKKARSEIDVAMLDRLKKRIALLKQTMGEYALIGESSSFFIEYAETIMDRAECEKLLMTVDVRAEYVRRKGKVDKQDEFIFGLVDSIRGHYTKAPSTERDEIYNEVKTLMEASLEYNM